MSDYERVLVAARHGQGPDHGWRTEPGTALKANEMSHHGTPETANAGSSAGDQPVCEVLTQRQLPTMQRNALGKVFDRSDFTPGEVARLGHRRIERAEGIGRKGLATIIEWLRCHGFELADDTLGSQSRTSANSPKEVKKVEKAMRVLQIHGYTILRSEQSEDGDTVGCTSPKTPGISA